MKLAPPLNRSAPTSSTATWSRTLAESPLSTPACRATGESCRPTWRRWGRSLEDVRVVILTYGDTDHIGLAERLRRERGVTVHWTTNIFSAFSRVLWPIFVPFAIAES